jgi:citrate synthase
VDSVPHFRWSADFLNMMFASDQGGDERTQTVFDDAVNLLLLLHADHEQNCSTSTARMVASSEASTHAAMSAAVGALSGPRHGGANQAVIEMLEQLLVEGADVPALLASVRAGERKLMGFGHRVYKNQDPRAVLLKRAANDLVSKLSHQEPLLRLAVELEQAALDDDYFQERRLFANVDFYSGLIYRALGIPTTMYPMMFALGRVPGWLAQVSELRGEKYRIHRPRQLYVGPAERRPPANSLVD